MIALYYNLYDFLYAFGGGDDNGNGLDDRVDDYMTYINSGGDDAGGGGGGGKAPKPSGNGNNQGCFWITVVVVALLFIIGKCSG